MDIAVLKFSAQVEFTDYIQPICLNSNFLKVFREVENVIQGKTDLTLAGWGRKTAFDGNSQPDLLNFGQMKLTNNEQCEIWLQKGQNLTNQQLGVGSFCAGTISSGANDSKLTTNQTDSCSGDSGGPLMLKINQYWTLIGIVSWGLPQCGKNNQPGVYTNVEKYLGWIEEKTGVGSFDFIGMIGGHGPESGSPSNSTNNTITILNEFDQILINFPNEKKCLEVINPKNIKATPCQTTNPNQKFIFQKTSGQISPKFNQTFCLTGIKKQSKLVHQQSNNYKVKLLKCKYKNGSDNSSSFELLGKQRFVVEREHYGSDVLMMEDRNLQLQVDSRSGKVFVRKRVYVGFG